MSAAAVESVSFCLLTMGWSPFTGHVPARERVSWLRHQLAYLGFGISATVDECGHPLPTALVSKLDNDQARFMSECDKKRIEVVITDHEIIFKKGIST